MTGVGPERGDGVGIEVTPGVLRGVRLGSSEPGRVVAAAEVAVANRFDDRAMVDALLRLRAELGDARVPTRVAMFPPGSTLSRVDATGLTGVDLNALRADLAALRGATSSVLVDDGPRRWLVGVAWDDTEIRRIEELTERAGFIDVAVDPSPIALVRVVAGEITHVRRDAAPDQSFGALTSRGVVVAASALDSVGRMTPGLACSDDALSVGLVRRRRRTAGARGTGPTAPRGRTARRMWADARRRASSGLPTARPARTTTPVRGARRRRGGRRAGRTAAAGRHAAPGGIDVGPT